MCACSRAIRLRQEHEFRRWRVGRVPGHLVHSPCQSSVLVGQSPSTHILAYNCHHHPATAPQSIHCLKEGRRHHSSKTAAHPAFMASRRYLVNDGQWRHERASDPNLESLTIRTALVSKHMVVFSSSIYDGTINVQDVFLAGTTRCEIVP